MGNQSISFQCWICVYAFMFVCIHHTWIILQRLQSEKKKEFMYKVCTKTLFFLLQSITSRSRLIKTFEHFSILIILFFFKFSPSFYVILFFLYSSEINNFSICVRNAKLLLIFVLWSERASWMKWERRKITTNDWFLS